MTITNPKAKETGTKTYCVDIRMKYEESDRQELIVFLRAEKEVLPAISEAECGRWEGKKILRVYTADAESLKSYIVDEYFFGGGYNYVIHLTETDALSCMHYLPDLDTVYGSKKFEI